MSKVIWHTLSSADWYQHFIPIYAYSIRKAYPDDTVYVGITGKADDITKRALAHVPNCDLRKVRDPYPRSNGVIVTQDVLLEVPQKKHSVINTLRYLIHPNEDPYANEQQWSYTFTTDLDFIVFPCKPTHLEWHLEKMKEMKTCYAGHHGPWKKPRRFPGGWKGDNERIAGGYFLATPEFYKKTGEAKDELFDQMLKNEQEDYREFDEVALCRIIKKSGLPVPKKGFSQELRGIHLGDFRDDMEHRYSNMNKMIVKLNDSTARKYYEWRMMDNTFRKIVNTTMECPKIAKIFKNLYEHLKARGIIPWK